MLAKRLAARRLVLEVTREARDWLAIGGFDPQYGARPLRRLVQSAIGDQLAKELLAGRIRDGHTVLVDVNDDDPGALIVRPVETVTAGDRADGLSSRHRVNRTGWAESHRLTPFCVVLTSRWPRRSRPCHLRTAAGSPWPGRWLRPVSRH